MTVLTRAQKERGISLAAQDGELRWSWGDWAYDVAPMDGLEDPDALLKEALAELAEGPGTLPRFNHLRTWREGAHAVRPELRHMVRSPWIGQIFWRHVKDDAEREALIRRLASEHLDGKNYVTERMARDAFGLKGKDGALVEAEEERTPSEQAQLLAELLGDQSVLNAIYNNDEARETLHGASFALFGRDRRADQDRQIIQNHLTEDEYHWQKFQRHIRAGEYGFAEWQSTKFEVTESRAEWLRDQGDYIIHVGHSLKAIAAQREITDEVLRQLLGR